MQFDHKTAFMMVGLFYVLVPAIVWALLRGHDAKKTAMWCGGGILGGIGTIWTAQGKGVVPDPYYGAVVAVIMTLGILLKIGTFRMLMGRIFNTHAWALFFVTYLGLELVADFHDLRGPYFLFTHLGFYAYLTWLSWRAYAQLHFRSILWIFCGYFVSVLTMLLIPLMGGEAEFWVSGIPAAMLAVIGAVVAFTNNIAFMGLVLEKSWAEQRAISVANSGLKDQGLLTRLLMISERERVLANLSRKLIHEIRQPLTSLSSGISLLRRASQDGRIEEVDVRGTLGRMNDSIELANHVLHQVTPLAKVRQQDATPINLSDLVDEVVAVSGLQPGGIQCHVHPEYPAGAYVLADRIGLMQVLNNIVRNAVQSCEQHGIAPEIRIDLSKQGDKACLVIHDYGPGFTDEAMNHIGHGIYTGRSEGMGLGLWVCREIVCQFEGELTFANKKGAEVTLSLPVRTGFRHE